MLLGCIAYAEQHLDVGRGFDLVGYRSEREIDVPYVIPCGGKLRPTELWDALMVVLVVAVFLVVSVVALPLLSLLPRQPPPGPPLVRPDSSVGRSFPPHGIT